MIALTFALPAESSDLRRLLRNKTSTRVEGALLVRGELHGKKISLFHTGVGAPICRRRLETLFSSENFTCLISAGFAGALTNQLRVGDLFIGENFSTPDLVSLARQLLSGLNPRFGKLASASVMIDSPVARREFASSTGAAAVDMETACIAEACTIRHLPLLSLRGISDTPAAGFPVPSNLLFDLRRQRTKFIGLAFHLAKHPAAVSRLIQFSHRISSTRVALTAAIAALLRNNRF